MRGLTLEMLGGFDLRTADGTILAIPTQKYRALLAFLSMPAGRYHPRDSLVALLWHDLPHEQARAALRQALWTLRRTLRTDGHDVLLQDGGAVALNAHGMRSDVEEFVATATQADRGSLERAAALYRGSFLAGLAARETPFEDWLATERERLDQMALGSLSRLLTLQRRDGSFDDAVQTGLRLLALDPLQEDVHRTLMATYLDLGRRGAALRQYQSCVSVLQRELGSEPGPATQALYRDVVRETAVRETPGRPSPRDDSAGGMRTTAPPTTAFDTPLIARERELTALRAALTDAVHGSGRVAIVTGEAGIGKSRLVTHLMSEAAASGVAMIVGRGYESAQVLPFGPWAEALRHADVLGPETVATLPAAARAEISRFVPELGDGPAAPSAVDDFTPLFEGVLGLIRTRARLTPLLIVLEDLHWADDMTLRLASFVARGVRAGGAVLMVLTGRDDGPDAGASLRWLHDDLERHTPVISVRLGALTQDETGRLVRALLGRRHAAMVDGMAQMVFTASEGHPLTVVEMVRSLPDLDNGELPPRLTLPERVRRLIDRRFELLSAGARHALGVAAVIGRDFEYRLFARACGTPADDAVGGLEELVRRRVLHAVGDRFAFTHDRLREVAYADLIAPRRRLLHRRVAEAMEALVGTQAADHHASIGAHYADAEVWEPAARHFRDAARVAHERLAFRDGVVLSERALAALRRLDRTQDTIGLEIDARLRLFRCLTPLGDPAAGEQVMLAQTLLADARDESREAIVLVELAELRRSARQLDAALEAGRQALTVAARLGHERVRALAHFQVGVAHFTRAAYPEAVEHLTATISLLAHAPLPEQLGYPYVPALCRLSWAYVDLDDLDAARRYAEAALRVAEAGDHIPSSAEALTTLAVLRLACGRPGDAIAPLERATELAQTCGVPYLGSFSGSWLALAYARCRRDDDAKIVLDECEARRVWEHVRLQWSRIVVRLGEARRLIGHIDRAGHLAEQGYMLAKSIGEPLGEIEALRLLARASSRRPPTRTSGLRDALAVAERIRVPGVTRELRAELTQTRRRPARSRATAG